MRKLVLTTVLMLGAQSAWAWQSAGTPSLGEIAERTKKDRETRRGNKPAKRVVTEADLKPAPAVASDSSAGGGDSAAAEAPAGGAGEAKAAKTDEELRAEKKREFEKKIAEQVQTVGVIRKAMEGAQNELNDPTTATQLGARGAALRKLLDDGQVELKKAEAAIAVVEEDARRQGISVSRP